MSQATLPTSPSFTSYLLTCSKQSAPNCSKLRTLACHGLLLPSKQYLPCECQHGVDLLQLLVTLFPDSGLQLCTNQQVRISAVLFHPPNSLFKTVLSQHFPIFLVFAQNVLIMNSFKCDLFYLVGSLILGEMVSLGLCHLSIKWQIIYWAICLWTK